MCVIIEDVQKPGLGPGSRRSARAIGTAPAASQRTASRLAVRLRVHGHEGGCQNSGPSLGVHIKGGVDIDVDVDIDADS